MDISQFDYRASAEAGFTFTVKHPESGKDTDIQITVVGADSKPYRKAFSAEVRRGASDDIDVDESNARVYSACVQSWSGITENGKEVECTPENAFRILDQYTWISKQVGAAVERRANFTTAQEKA